MTPAPPGQHVFRHEGHCPICGKAAVFTARHQWFRDHLICETCRSIPRERALFAVVEMYYPDWRSFDIHESSPVKRGASLKFQREAKSYLATQFDPALPLGTVDAARSFRNENLEQQTFADESFDLVITQDVFEHVFHPDRAISEIARTLRPGGAHICTVPITRKAQPSVRRAALVDGKIVHHLEPQYHGNPISSEGSLVTVDWGYDIASYLARASGLDVTMVVIDDIDRGIRAALIEVLVCRKPAAETIVI